MLKIFEQAKYDLRNHKYTKISENMIDAGTNNVSLVTKKGRSVLLCSCTGSSRFADDNLCSHKVLFLLVNFYEPLSNKLKEIESQYKSWKTLNFKINPQQVLDDLEKIKRMLNE